MGWEQWVSCGLLGIGVFFALTGSLGVLRMPDFYSRLHPAGKSDTLAQALILMGLLVLVIPTIETNYGIALKVALLTGLLFVTAPTSTHAISKAALLDPRMPRHWVASDAGELAPETGATDAEHTEAERAALVAEETAASKAGTQAEQAEAEQAQSLVDMGRHPDWDHEIAGPDADAGEEGTDDE